MSDPLETGPLSPYDGIFQKGADLQSSVGASEFGEGDVTLSEPDIHRLNAVLLANIFRAQLQISEGISQVVALLTEMREETKKARPMPTPWAMPLTQELLSRQDMDGNGLIFGKDFAFDDGTALPVLLQDAQKKAVLGTPNRMSLAAYAATVPDVASDVLASQ